MPGEERTVINTVEQDLSGMFINQKGATQCHMSDKLGTTDVCQALPVSSDRLGITDFYSAARLVFTYLIFRT